MVGQLGELVLLLLERLQQTADLLLGQHHPAVVLRRKKTSVTDAKTPLENARACISYLLKGFLTVQAGGGHLGQQDGHVLLLLPQPDQPLPDVGVHHAQRHLLLPTQRLVEVCEVSPHAGARALGRPGDLRGGGRRRTPSSVRRRAQRCTHRRPTRQRSHVFCVRHAHAVLHDLLSAFYLLDDSHQLAGVFRHLVGEGPDAVGHVQDGRADLVGFSFKKSMLEMKPEHR